MTRHRRGEPAIDTVENDDLIDRGGPVGPHTLTEEELSAIWRAKLMFRVLIVVGVVFALTMATLIASGVWLIRGTQIHNTHVTHETRRLAQQTKRTSDLIQSCVSPDGKCYRDGQKRTSAAVGNINEVVIAAAVCAGGVSARLPIVQRQDLIQSCVNERLARASRK